MLGIPGSFGIEKISSIRGMATSGCVSAISVEGGKSPLAGRVSWAIRGDATRITVGVTSGTTTRADAVTAQSSKRRGEVALIGTAARGRLNELREAWRSVGESAADLT